MGGWRWAAACCTASGHLLCAANASKRWQTWLRLPACLPALSCVQVQNDWRTGAVKVWQQRVAQAGGHGSCSHRSSCACALLMPQSPRAPLACSCRLHTPSDVHVES